jgi:hypothetical protein
MPGFPDNISLSDSGLVWVSLPAPRVPQRLQPQAEDIMWSEADTEPINANVCLVPKADLRVAASLVTPFRLESPVGPRLGHSCRRGSLAFVDHQGALWSFTDVPEMPP